MNQHNINQYVQKQVNQANIVELCRDKAYCVYELADLCNLSKSAIARQVRGMGEWLAKSKAAGRGGMVYYSTIRPDKFPVMPFVARQKTEKEAEPEFIPLPGGRIIRFDGKDGPDHYPERFEYTIKKRYYVVSGSSLIGLAEALG